MVPLIFSFVFPFLLVMAVLQSLYVRWRGPQRHWAVPLMLGAASLGAVLMPLNGLPAARWLAGFYPGFSIPVTALVLGVVWERVFGLRLFSPEAIRSIWIFGLAAGICLYPMALGVGDFDPYTLGWGFSWFFVAILIPTLVLLLLGNGLGIVLSASIAAYHLGLLESTNFWDYLVDPLYFLMSAGAVLGRLLRGVFGAKEGRGTVPAERKHREGRGGYDPDHGP